MCLCNFAESFKSYLREERTKASEKEKHTQVSRCKSTKNKNDKLLPSETAVGEQITASRNLYFYTVSRSLRLHSHQYQAGAGTCKAQIKDSNNKQAYKSRCEVNFKSYFI